MISISTQIIAALPKILRATNIRPVLVPPLPPCPPQNAITLSTPGSSATILAYCFQDRVHQLEVGRLVGDDRPGQPAGILLGEENPWGPLM